jgi:alkylated DNA repair dioxygenase AlkB
VSFGAPRDFVLRHNTEHGKKISTTLSAGDVLIMAGSTQQHWQHSIPKRKGVLQPRINLTFRRIVES